MRLPLAPPPSPFPLLLGAPRKDNTTIFIAACAPRSVLQACPTPTPRSTSTPHARLAASIKAPSTVGRSACRGEEEGDVTRRSTVYTQPFTALYTALYKAFLNSLAHPYTYPNDP